MTFGKRYQLASKWCVSKKCHCDTRKSSSIYAQPQIEPNNYSYTYIELLLGTKWWPPWYFSKSYKLTWRYVPKIHKHQVSHEKYDLLDPSTPQWNSATPQSSYKRALLLPHYMTAFFFTHWAIFMNEMAAHAHIYLPLLIRSVYKSMALLMPVLSKSTKSSDNIFGEFSRKDTVMGRVWGYQPS